MTNFERIKNIAICGITEIWRYPGFIGVLVAMAAAYAAYDQSNVWRDEYRSTKQYDITADFLRSLYRLENLIKDLRYSGIRQEEMGLHEGKSVEWNKWLNAESEAEQKRQQPLVDIERESNLLESAKHRYIYRWNMMVQQYGVLEDLAVELRVHGVEGSSVYVRRLEEFIGGLRQMFERDFALRLAEIERDKRKILEARNPGPGPALDADQVYKIELENIETDHFPDAPAYAVEKVGDLSESDELEQDLEHIVKEIEDAVARYRLGAKTKN